MNHLKTMPARLGLLGICLCISLAAACLSALLFVWILKHPEVSILALFAVWIIRFGWTMGQNDLPANEADEKKIIPLVRKQAGA